MNKQSHINGGLADAIYAINNELKNRKIDKKVFGFEKSKEGYKKLRFFNKDNETIWLPKDLYDTYNSFLVKNGALEMGRKEFQEPKSNFATIYSMFQKKFGNHY